MEISVYLNELLLKNDSVTLPTFGTFAVNYHSAQINPDEKGVYSFFPPVRTLTFNSQLVSNDGLLVNHIANVKNIGKVEAFAWVMEAIKKITSALENGEKVILNSIGSFYNYDGKYLYQPDPTANFLLSSYGLTSFQFSEIKRTVNTAGIAATAETKPEEKGDTKIYLWLVGASLLILLILVALNTNFFNLFDNNNRIADNKPVIENNVTPNNSNNTPVIVDTAKTVVPKDTAKNQNQQTVTPPQNNTNNNVAPDNYKYYIIAGSFTDKNKVDAEKERITKLGYSTEIINNGNLFRISVGGFNNHQEAVQQLNKINSEKKITVWLLVK